MSNATMLDHVTADQVNAQTSLDPYAAEITDQQNVARPTQGDTTIANYTINFGPQHPAAHGVLRLVMEL
ncbi:MAG: hypothetical protein ACRYHC_15675, partial [Janthinobacterium lividum]